MVGVSVSVDHLREPRRATPRDCHALTSLQRSKNSKLPE